MTWTSPPLRAVVVFIASLILVDKVLGVDHSVFKTCSQSSFCRRSRTLQPGTSDFQLVANTKVSTDSSVELNVINSANNHLFLLKVVALESGTFRVQIDEKNPLKTRYRIQDALQAEPTVTKITSVSEASSGDVTIVVGANKLVAMAKPLRLDFYQNDVLVVSANSKGLMRFEHLRAKPTATDPVGTAPEDTDADSWTESFNGFIDNKPNGPEAIALDFGFPEAKVLFGIPLHADSLALKPTTVNGSDPYRLYNLDVAFHEIDSKMSLYGAVPVLYGHGSRRTAGVFWHNSAETWVDIYEPTGTALRSANFITESGIVDAFIMLGPNPKDVFGQYTKLTGVVPLPQTYTLGYHQCRWNYDNQSDVMNVAAGFDQHDLPLDTMWLDIEYTDQKKYFTWDPVAFSDPLNMIANLSAGNRHLTVIVDIHLKSDPTYSVNTDCISQNLYTKTETGVDFVGDCWPGAASYPDVFEAAPRDYLASRYSVANFPGTTENVMIWNDMNEPSVFDGPEKTMPKTNLHHGATVEHRNLHNQFGHMQVRSTFKGLGERSNWQQRPFILTRSHFAGSHRYSIIWTGDNTAEFGYLQVSIKECLAEAVAGFSFCGADVGGFFGHPTDELFERWFQAAAFTPFYRSHANLGTPRREPWLFPVTTLNRVRAAIKKRYTYLPFWYTMFYEHQRYGLPVMRPLLTQYPTDEAVFAIDDTFMLSDALLVSPVMIEGATTRAVYFPNDVWYDTDDYTKYNETGFKTVQAGGDKTPVYQRGGTVIPRRMIERKASDLMINDPYTLIICVNTTNSATGHLYIDDGKSYGYQSGQYIYARLHFNGSHLTSTLVDLNASYPTTTVVEQVILVGLDWTPTKATIEKGSVSGSVDVTKQGNSFVLSKSLNVKMVEEWSIVFSGSGRTIVSMMIWPIVALVFGWSRFL